MPGELILIVEDDANSRKLARDVLAFHGFSTLEAETGEEGVRLAEQHLPALILMDIHLPGITGIEALRALRAMPATRSIPVMAVTASVLSEEQENVMDAGFDAFERKPLVLKGFVDRLRAVMDARGGPAPEAA